MTKLNEPEICLRALLADGARGSREVVATMSDGGFTPKQVRRAREQLGVVARRFGCRAAMRSTWELPNAAPSKAQEQRPFDVEALKASARPRARLQRQMRAAQVDAGGDGVEGSVERYLHGRWPTSARPSEIA